MGIWDYWEPSNYRQGMGVIPYKPLVSKRGPYIEIREGGNVQAGTGTSPQISPLGNIPHNNSTLNLKA